MTKQAFLNDKEIEKFLAEDDDLIDSDEDDYAIGELETDLGELRDEENSSEEVSADEDDVPLNVLLEESDIITFSKTILRGKNRHKWSTQKATSHRYGQNIVHQVRGPTRLCKNIVDPLQVFRLFITDAIIEEIVEWTNVEISTRSCINSTESAQRKETNNEEIEALIGMLALTAAMRDNHLSIAELFDQSYSGSKYLSTMTHNRFKFLMSCLRFDDKAVRVGLIADKFAPIRKVWDIFIQKCRENYTPGPYMTIDEQLVPFRGRCGFKMYIPNKPAKYGLKIVMMCDSGTKYMVDAKPYLGKGSSDSNLPLAENFVKELTKSIYGTNRNVTMDNWFTSVSLAKSLLKEPYKLTLVGTLRSNKREIPPEMKVSKGRKCGTSMFAYDNELTLLSYKPKPNKIIYLLSSCNENGTVNSMTKTPHMIEFYNSTKGGVDTFDQMCSVMSCARKTNRWPMAVFFGILNMAYINSYVIYTLNMFQLGQKPLSRRKFMKGLHSALIQKHLYKRLNVVTLKTAARQNIQSGLVQHDENAKNSGEVSASKKRKICAICPSSKRRMTKSSCAKCQKSLCGEHKIDLCASCAK